MKFDTKRKAAPATPAEGLIDSPEELLRRNGIDPDAFIANNAWIKTPGVSLHVAAKGSAAAPSLTAERIEEILTHWAVADVPDEATDSVFYVTIADAQLGKPDGGGTPATVRRVKNAVAEAVTRVRWEHGKVHTIIIANIGDFIEGAVSQNGKLPNDVGVAKQIEIAQSLLFEAAVALAPYAQRLVVATVPSNHGETRRDRNTSADDNFDITIAKGAQLALSGRPGFEHVEFAYPEDDEVYVVVPHVHGSLGIAHGHVGTNTPESFKDRYVKNARASHNHPLSDCNVIGSGHFHHGRWEDTGHGYDWVQAPALESGSNWFRQIFSKDSKKGILTGYLTRDGFELGQIHQGRG